jgi:hypothetical protein
VMGTALRYQIDTHARYFAGFPALPTTLTFFHATDGQQ